MLGVTGCSNLGAFLLPCSRSFREQVFPEAAWLRSVGPPGANWEALKSRIHDLLAVRRHVVEPVSFHLVVAFSAGDNVPERYSPHIPTELAPRIYRIVAGAPGEGVSGPQADRDGGLVFCTQRGRPLDFHNLRVAILQVALTVRRASPYAIPRPPLYVRHPALSRSPSEARSRALGAFFGSVDAGPLQPRAAEDGDQTAAMEAVLS